MIKSFSSSVRGPALQKFLNEYIFSLDLTNAKSKTASQACRPINMKIVWSGDNFSREPHLADDLLYCVINCRQRSTTVVIDVAVKRYKVSKYCAWSVTNVKRQATKCGTKD